MYNVAIDISEVKSKAALQEVIAGFCDELLQRQPQKLSQIIYRIDLKETLVSQVLINENKEKIPLDLAALMIKRTEAKIELKSVLESELKKNKKLPRY